MQVLILAAGMGNRLAEYTQSNTKCMVDVAGEKILDRAIKAITYAGIKKIVIVVGYEKDGLISHINKKYADSELNIVFIENNDYVSTNNIYSLYIARDELAKDDTILLESDLVFDENLINEIVLDEEPNLVTVAKYEHWMDGTVTRLNENDEIVEFIEKQDFSYDLAKRYYKTVNIYKFSKGFIDTVYLPFLEAYIKVYGKNQYYESVLKIIAYIEKIKLKAYVLNSQNWYEIDTPQDLDIANVLFSDKNDKFNAYDGHYGGFWRFPKLKDFCYLVNPYYPPQKLIEQMNYFSSVLIREYPSGLDVQNRAVAHMFHIKENHIIVGNGAAELINVLGLSIKGKIGRFVPVFNEYIDRFKQDYVEYNTRNYDYKLSLADMKQDLEHLDAVIIVNPDNPSGAFIEKEQMIEFIDDCHHNNVRIIIDESFIDFSEREIRYTLIDEDILNKYPNLIVIKSISKSYGIPGLRLGVLAGSDMEFLSEIKSHMSIWNINSYAEYFLQIQHLYKNAYGDACDKIASERKYLVEKLSQFKNMYVYSSQANYIMCKLIGDVKALDLANKLIQKYDVFIKDLSQKYAFDGGEYIRIAVKNRDDNDYLLNALRDILH